MMRGGQELLQAVGLRGGGHFLGVALLLDAALVVEDMSVTYRSPRGPVSSTTSPEMA